MQAIELDKRVGDKWEMKTLKELGEEFCPIIQKEFGWDGEYAANDPDGCLEGFSAYWYDKAKYEAPLPDKYWRVICYAVAGASEGHYIHVDLILSHGEPGKLVSLFSGKTFSGGAFAQKVANRCAVLLDVI